MTELIKVIRDDGNTADIRPDWLEQWQEWGWKTEQAEQAKPEGDELDALDAEALHALAKERGVNVHHKAGADKVREALREAAKD